MQMFVKFRVFETVLGTDGRGPVGGRIKAILESGKVSASGVCWAAAFSTMRMSRPTR